ncbi:MAG TPA: formylglycine-generating enzyme family protein [Blastocatellia bacterium]|nr:formylglycine-generating enzyme family protein [Blastocatellia bacterium]HMX29157.1 formylglycine-generating enzyme family protein [Blastocatellia bacterium]HMY74717.1 formylglycine-generating enzyme family protein [Blastocatellia bacterium]
MLIVALSAASACKQTQLASDAHAGHNHGSESEKAACETQPSSRAAAILNSQAAPQVVKGSGETAGMVWIPAGEFMMGASGKDEAARPDEHPAHKVRVDGFWMDETEVTNAQFAAFVKATGYLTTAERTPDWEEMKKQLPPGTPKPPPDVLVPGSLVFKQPGGPVPLDNASLWWAYTPHANWQQPEGQGSSIAGKDTFPAVHISWDDAVAYAKWAGKRLPSEAEWEWAARGGIAEAVFAWGDEPIEQGTIKANTWQGHFPDQNSKRDGFYASAPVRSFKANGYGLFDMAGNVWEWCSDWYRPDYFAQTARPEGVKNPQGPDSSFDPDEPTVPKRVQRGGSFLCHDSYCASYRVAARMKASPDTGLMHAGFRCVKAGSQK